MELVATPVAVVGETGTIVIPRRTPGAPSAWPQSAGEASSAGVRRGVTSMIAPTTEAAMLELEVEVEVQGSTLSVSS